MFSSSGSRAEGPRPSKGGLASAPCGYGWQPVPGRLCRAGDRARIPFIDARNQREWMKNAALSSWMPESRLDGMSAILINAGDGETRFEATAGQMRGTIGPAVETLTRLPVGARPGGRAGR